MANERVWQKFCNESTMHGFHELFYAKTLYFKAFWLLVIISGVCMTCFQIYQVAYAYNANPTKTQIELLPSSETIRSPPPSFSLRHWCDWANLTKFKEYRFDLDTALYAMSYFNPLYTKRKFNLAEADAKLGAVMTRLNVSTVWDLGFWISQYKPSAIYSYESYNRHFGIRGELIYSLLGNPKTALASGELNFFLFTNFSATNFSRTFSQLFDNYTFLEEYQYFKRHQLADNPDNESLISSMSVDVNPTAGKSTYYDLSLLTIKYKFFLKGTKYVWLSTDRGPCETNANFSFYTECELTCNTKFKIYRPQTCRIYFLDENSPFQDTNKMDNQCESHAFASTWLAHETADTFQYQKCLDECTSSCEQLVYEFNQALYPRQISVQNEYVKGLVRLFFSENNLLVTILPAVLWYDAVANVGGLLGLWMGGSILSFIQLVYIFCCLNVETALIGWKTKSTISNNVFKNNDDNNNSNNNNSRIVSAVDTEPRAIIEKLRAEIQHLQSCVDKTIKKH